MILIKPRHIPVNHSLVYETIYNTIFMSDITREDELEVIKYLGWLQEHNPYLTFDWNFVMYLIGHIEDTEMPVSLNPEDGGYYPYTVDIQKRKTIINKDDKIVLIAHGKSKIDGATRACLEFIKSFNKENA